MSLKRGAIVAALALGAASGCGGSAGHSNTGAAASATTSTPSTSASPSSSRPPPAVRSGESSGSGVITVPGVGSLSYRCDRAKGVVSAVLGGRITATESVYVEGDGHRHLRSATRVDTPPFSVADTRTATLLWHVIQSTEPRTLDVRIAIDFHPAAGGPACSPTRWTSTVYVISHQGAWSEPQGWL